MVNTFTTKFHGMDMSLKLLAYIKLNNTDKV